MKERYENAEMDITMFDVEDVINTSDAMWVPSISTTYCKYENDNSFL